VYCITAEILETGNDVKACKWDLMNDVTDAAAAVTAATVTAAVRSHTQFINSQHALCILLSRRSCSVESRRILKDQIN